MMQTNAQHGANLGINSLKILFIEDNLADADWIGEILREEKLVGLTLKHTNRVKEGLHLLAQDYFDVVLLDLSLRALQGIDTLAMVKQQAPEVPIIVLTSLNDRNMAIKSLRQGAQDYLIKGGFDQELLLRSIHYAIERQRTEVKLRQQAERARLMGKIFEKIRQSLELTEILAITVDEVRQFLKTEQVLIYCCSSSRPGQIVAESPINQNSCCSKTKVTLKANLVDLYLAGSDAAHLQAIEDEQLIPTLSSAIYPSTENQLRAILTLPIWLSPQMSPRLRKFEDNLHNSDDQKKQLWGMLVAYSQKTSRPWPTWKIDFLKQLTNQLTIAIQQSELYHQLQQVNQRLKQLALRDGLTGVANRRYFEQVLNKEWNRLAREKKPLSLIFCDLDDFKVYNDTYGHPEGDSCLKKVALVLQQATKRPADLVARYGGEEFAVILPDTNARGAFWVAETMREKLNTQKIPHSGSSISPYVTMSIGIATAIPLPGQNASPLLEKADRALYQAKKQGRNQISPLF